MLERVVIFALVGFGIASCVGDAGPTPGADASTSSDGSVGGDGSTCSGTMQSGTVACTNVVSALCMRRVSCCTSATPNACPSDTRLAAACTCFGCTAPTGQCTGTYCGDTCSMQSCSAWMQHDPSVGYVAQARHDTANAGYDCAAARFANAQVCSNAAAACVGDVSLIACSDFTDYPTTWNWPASCMAFWSQFK